MTTIEELPLTTTTVRAACPHDCPDTCAMLVTVEDGRATAVARRPRPPVHPRRPLREGQQLPRPRLRPGPRAAPDAPHRPEGQRPVRADHLGRRRSRDRRPVPGADRTSTAPRPIMPVSYLGTQGILNGLNVGDPFFHRLGATVTERTYCDSGACTAYADDDRRHRGRRPGEPRALEVHPPVGVQHDLHEPAPVAVHRRGPASNGAKVVVHRPDAHRTARRADWHIPIRPGTDGALALAMMHVIIAEGLTDEDYVAQLHRRLRRARRARRSSTPRSGRGRRPGSRPRTSARWPASTRPRSRR